MWWLGQGAVFLYEHTNIWRVLEANPITPVGENDPPWPTTAAPNTRLIIESGMMPAVFTPNKMTQHSHRITFCTAIQQVTLSHSRLIVPLFFCGGGMPAQITRPGFGFPEETSLSTEKTGSPSLLKKWPWSCYEVLSAQHFIGCIPLPGLIKMSHCWLIVCHLTVGSPSN